MFCFGLGGSGACRSKGNEQILLAPQCFGSFVTFYGSVEIGEVVAVTSHSAVETSTAQWTCFITKSLSVTVRESLPNGLYALTGSILREVVAMETSQANRQESGQRSVSCERPEGWKGLGIHGLPFHGVEYRITMVLFAMKNQKYLLESLRVKMLHRAEGSSNGSSRCLSLPEATTLQ